jgi:hypothetical protein
MDISKDVIIYNSVVLDRQNGRYSYNLSPWISIATPIAWDAASRIEIIM